MQIGFTNSNKETFTIGSVSFNFLDQKNVFDEFQEDHDYYSELILKVSEHNTLKLANKIRETVDNRGGDLTVRLDLVEKTYNLANFIENSKGIEVYIN